MNRWNVIIQKNLKFNKSFKKLYFIIYKQLVFFKICYISLNNSFMNSESSRDRILSSYLTNSTNSKRLIKLLGDVMFVNFCIFLCLSSSSTFKKEYSKIEKKF